MPLSSRPSPQDLYRRRKSLRKLNIHRPIRSSSPAGPKATTRSSWLRKTLSSTSSTISSPGPVQRHHSLKESDVPNSKVIDVTGYHMPCPGRVTSNYGYRAKFGRMHKGIDLQIRSNDTIYAAFDGKVRLTNYEARGYGNYVILRHPNGLETVYGHLNKALVKADQVVRAGQPIALGGSTGRSTGPHLHFETRYMGYAINPSAIFDFVNQTTHTDTYTFSKSTYTKPRSFAPKTTLAKNDKENTYQGASNVKSTYTVRRGDTLSSIARSYGMSATTLRKINGLASSDVIQAGQVLKLK